MENRTKPPLSFKDLKSEPPRVEVTREPQNEADIIATRNLVELYTQPDGFHCPKCGVVFTTPDDAVYHLAEEINKALAHLSEPTK